MKPMTDITLHIHQINTAHVRRDWEEYHDLKRYWYSLLGEMSQDGLTKWTRYAEESARALGLGSF